MMSHTSSKSRPGGFTLTEAILTIAIVGIMASLVLSAISNASRDAQRIVARQQQAAVQNALNAWVMSQTRVSGSSQVKSLNDIRSSYNSVGTALARFNLLVPSGAGTGGYLDQTTADHFLEYTTNTDRLKTAALDQAKQHLELPNWAAGSFPKVDLVND